MKKNEILNILRELCIDMDYPQVNGQVKVKLINPYLHQDKWERLESVLNYGVDPAEEKRDS